ncbi:M28 family metallopeptidase [Maribacter arcticus]|uniref:Peptidase family M28 n=1 Tax=Maribacter arcticus TaxID=561365 RepID=A0A1T5DIK2_9FLAO|nr:M28 family peptidase [Maribacter arcticus]SKB71519.1 Peptidase family M28 [Maribacter arcticus]|tara:strand:+ start:1691 stop:2740 length:1050 start_codon:yes stop_codon:yes gene_type:complete
MKHIILVFFGFLLVSCSGAKMDQSTILNPNNETKNVRKDVLQNTSNGEDVKSSILTSKLKAYSTPENIEDIMVYLTSDELQGRDTGSEGISKAADFIENVFKKNNIQPYFTSYRDTLTNYTDGTAFNVVGYLPGTDAKLKNEFVVIGAHYDHIGLMSGQVADSIANGANDNASGTTTVLEFSKYFGELKGNKRSIIFALFSAEEKGLLGSKHLAGKLKDKNIDLYAMLNFEMVGVPMVDKDHSLYLTGYELSNLAEVSNRYAHKNLVGFLSKAKEFNLFRRSDNAPFHDVFNVPSQTYSTFDFTNFGEYHKVGDEASLMDYMHMATIVNETIPMITGIVNSPIKELKYN